jgi:hypothetical protein
MFNLVFGGSISSLMLIQHWILEGEEHQREKSQIPSKKVGGTCKTLQLDLGFSQFLKMYLTNMRSAQKIKFGKF